jgi:excisionase family DNA binding protein
MVFSEIIKNMEGMMEKNSGTNQQLGTIMTVHDVADYLRLSEATIYQMARQGRIPVSRMGRTWRFKKERIDEWLDIGIQQEKKAL